MSKATARTEIPALAEKCGFEIRHTHGRLVAYYHAERNEGFQLICEGEEWESATWHAPTEFVAVVDRRMPGQYGKRDGVSLGSTAKQRAVGVSDVRAEMRTDTRGMDIGYLDIKRRLRNPGWRTAA